MKVTSKAKILIVVISIMLVLGGGQAFADVTVNAGNSDNPNHIQEVILPVTHDFGESASVERDYDANNEKATFNIEGLAGNSGAIFFDTDNDREADIQLSFHNDPDSFPWAQIWVNNNNGKWEKDTRYQDKEQGYPLNFDSETTALDLDENKAEMFNGTISKDSVSIKVNETELDSSFKYGIKDPNGGNFDFEVDDGGWDDDATDDELTGGTVPVEPVSSGDTIDVVSGTYDESVDISTANVTLEGPNAGTAGYNSRASEATIEQGVEISADSVKLDGFKITNNGGNGVKVSDAPSSVVITNNRVADIAGGTAGANKSYANGINLQFTDAFEKTSSGIEITNNEITDITTADMDAYNNDAIGIQLLPRGNDVENLTISDNVISSIDPGDASDSGRSEARGISIDTQFVDGPNDDDPRGDYGQPIGLTIEGNEIRNLSSEFSRAINLFEDKTGAVSNKNTPIGPVDFVIKGNTVEQITSTRKGLPAESLFVGGYENLGDDHQVVNNNFLAAVQNFEGDGQDVDNLDAVHNWWGHKSGPSWEGPGEGAGVSTNVKYDPWLNASDGNLVTGDTQQLDFVQGWQMISTNVVPFNPSPSGVFDTHLGNVFAYDAEGDYGENEEFKGEYVSGNDLSSVDVSVTEGYWVYLHNPNSETDLEVEGFTPAEEKNIEFTEGGGTWYMFSVPFETPWSDVSFKREGIDEDLAPKVASSSDNDLIYGKVYTYNTEYDPDVSDSDPYIVAAETDRGDIPVDVGILKANKAYWIRVDEADSGETPLTMTIPYQPGDTPSTGESAMAAATVSKPVPEDAPQPPVPPMINQASGKLKATAAVNDEAVSFEVAGKEVSSISVQVFDMDGQKVFSGTSAGNSLSWDADVPNGVYLYGTTAKVNGETKPLGIQKLLVLR